MDVPPLVYAYLGSPLPSYARYSIAMVRERISGPMILLTDRPNGLHLDGVNIVDVRGWYDAAPFENFARNSPLDALFRGGFWLKAVERFFLLHQYMVREKLPRLFHAELDVLVFSIDGLAERLDEHGTGCFIPAQRNDRAIASLVYVNDKAALAALLDFFQSNTHLGNEMNMLGHFLAERPDIGHGLPSESVLDSGIWPVCPSSVTPGVGLFDASAFGLWVFGYDPRNIRGSSWNHFREGTKTSDLSGVRFRSDFMARRVTVRSGSSSRPLRAIHIHAKIFSRFRIPGLVWLYFLLAAAPFRIPIILSTGRVQFFVLSKMLSSRFGAIASRLPRPVKLLIGPVLTLLVSRTPKILSERERGIVIGFLADSPLGHSTVPHEVMSVTALNDFPLGPHWKALFTEVDRKREGELRREIAVFLDALQAQSPRVYFYGEHMQREPRTLLKNGKQVLFVSEEKHYIDSKHALTFWNEKRLSNRWSFVAPAQLVQPAIVREMFPLGEDDVFLWAKMGIQQREPSLSAFQSYGTWLSGEAKRKWVFARY